ncbi:hypothetical protein V9T40_001649 [Parthenolecanium corni]|uniref:Uncharacterized protein n=1 Tax=Parthenolecanium corni TaxID=536013 RepID=A0AAN9Y5B6_9HEMI
MQFIDAKIRQTFSEPDDILKAIAELASYKCSSEFFGEPFVKDSAKVTPALTCIQGLIHNAKRNRLKADSAGRVAFIHYNIICLGKPKPKQKSSQSQKHKREAEDEEEYFGAYFDNADAECEYDNDSDLDWNHLAIEEVYVSLSDDESNKIDQTASSPQSHSPHLQLQDLKID